jgi:hypothetical protein
MSNPDVVRTRIEALCRKYDLRPPVFVDPCSGDRGDVIASMGVRIFPNAQWSDEQHAQHLFAHWLLEYGTSCVPHAERVVGILCDWLAKEKP